MSIDTGRMDILTYSEELYREVIRFDAVYCTKIHDHLSKRKPQDAFDHIRNFGIGKKEEIDGYLLIYTWLWEEISPSVEATQTEVRWKTSDLLGSAPRVNTTYRTLLNTIGQSIEDWVRGQLSAGSDLGWLKTFSDRTPEESPLRTSLDTLLGK